MDGRCAARMRADIMLHFALITRAAEDADTSPLQPEADDAEYPGRLARLGDCSHSAMPRAAASVAAPHFVGKRFPGRSACAPPPIRAARLGRRMMTAARLLRSGAASPPRREARSPRRASSSRWRPGYDPPARRRCLPSFDEYIHTQAAGAIGLRD